MADTSASFSDFYLSPEILHAISDARFEHPSAVQVEALPDATAGYDLLVQAKSGMGKTAVFTLSTLHRFIKWQDTDPFMNKIQVLVVCHSHELTYQIAREFTRFATHITGPRRCLQLVGGVPVKTHMQLLQNNDDAPFAVGCPGRINDLVKRGALDLSDLKVLIFDECDKLVDAHGMSADLKEIFGAAVRQRGGAEDLQVMCFSATMSAEARDTLKTLFLKDPREIIIDEPKKLRLESLTHFEISCAEEEKLHRLNELLKDVNYSQAVIFCRTPQKAELLQQVLEGDLGLAATYISSRMPEQQRMERFSKFRDFKYRILVSTGLFERGIDVQGVNLVVNFDMPRLKNLPRNVAKPASAAAPAPAPAPADEEPVSAADAAAATAAAAAATGADDARAAALGRAANDYHHRVGRAGRFATRGVCVSMVATDDDRDVMSTVRARFGIEVHPCPEHIDRALYQN